MKKNTPATPLTCAVADNLQGLDLESIDTSRFIDDIHKIIVELNNGYDFGRPLAEEWVHYLMLLLKGYKANLADPYEDIRHYIVKPFSQSTPDLDAIESLYFLDSLPDKSLPKSQNEHSLLRQSILILALGGTDTTFYKGLTPEESFSFAHAFYTTELVAAFDRYDAVDMIPRGFAAKKDNMNNSVTNVESMMTHAYLAGVRYIAIIANARTRLAIQDYLTEKFKNTSDLHIVVTAQPLLPRMRVESGMLHIDVQNGGYPGGHGHGFKYCLKDEKVRKLIQQAQLKYFIFCNGDNAVVFNWGGEHFEKAIDKLERLRDQAYSNVRIAFFLVWEYLRKGGFSFLLQDRHTGELMPQIFEAELAHASGADIGQLKKSRGGYNTNVALGFLKAAETHVDRLPMVLKIKKMPEGVYYTFEASLATAMTTHQRKDGSSQFDKNSAINILGPKTAVYQHWNHIALRKRDDLFAFFSSLFKMRDIRLSSGTIKAITTERNATLKHPTLAGNFVQSDLLNTKEFFDIFAHAFFDVDHFYGTLHIDLLKEEHKPRGKILFQRRIILQGDENAQLRCTVPAGELWIVSDARYIIHDTLILNRSDATIRQWHADKKEYV
ncbi:hypothetical protein EH223_17860 [candidate division KSB1 bacterium]|nr:hypothetical protein [candidate division KSB1 bacterium]RQW00615.1 MAG: hypothetical protein EH223_17860 [candidate division KSB1 bacterium]